MSSSDVGASNLNERQPRQRQSLGEIDLNVDYQPSPENCCREEVEYEDNFNQDDQAPTFDLNQDPLIDETQDLGTEDRPKKKSRNLNNNERRSVYDALLQRSVNGDLKGDTTKIMANMFSVLIRTVHRIWNRGKDTASGGFVDVSHRRPTNCGRKKVQVDLDRIRAIPLKQRTMLESLACALNTSKSIIFRLLKSGSIRCHSNAIKSDLTEENKKARVRFCLSMLDLTYFPNDPKFSSMQNRVHIDKKWFNMTKKKDNYYLVQDEEDPLRTCKNKNFIGKVMFLVAQARPRFDADGNVVLSGKIGVYPFITCEPAKRTSVNRLAGTLETKLISSVKKEVVRNFLIEKVIPDIQAKWPRGEKGPIFIQQDNARPHIRPDNPEFCAATSIDGYNIRLMCQPPNSPDLNVLDLGFFSAIQALQRKECPKNIDELVAAVIRSFETFSVIKSNHVFLTLQLCMIEILRGRGGNKYRIPHVQKATLEQEGRLPLQFACDATLVQDAINFLG